MTNPIDSMTVGTLLADVKAGLAGIDAALAVVDKFAVFLPAQYRTPLEELQKILSTVDGYVSKL